MKILMESVTKNFCLRCAYVQDKTMKELVAVKFGMIFNYKAQNTLNFVLIIGKTQQFGE